jgi:hypothetical protein
VIDALDLALARLLDDAAAPADVRGSEVSFEPLERTYRPTQVTVNLFLVDVQQNVELRNVVPVREPAEDGIRQEPPPIRVDCRYLLTVWAPTATTPAQRVADEHRLLASVMSWLARFPVLPASALGPRLTDQPVPVRLTVGLPNPGRGFSDLWNALGVPPRAAIWLSAVLALSAGEAEVVGKPVIDVDVRVDGGESPPVRVHQVGGRVRGPVGPLGEALVSVDALGRRVSTDASGVYRLGPVTEGTYELVVSAPGHLPVTRTVQVPPVTGDDYDVQLVPEN